MTLIDLLGQYSANPNIVYDWMCFLLFPDITCRIAVVIQLLKLTKQMQKYFVALPLFNSDCCDILPKVV